MDEKRTQAAAMQRGLGMMSMLSDVAVRKYQKAIERMMVSAVKPSTAENVPRVSTTPSQLPPPPINPEMN